MTHATSALRLSSHLLGHLLATVLCQLRHCQANDVTIIARVDAKVAQVNRFLNVLDSRLVKGLDGKLRSWGVVVYTHGVNLSLQ